MSPDRSSPWMAVCALADTSRRSVIVTGASSGIGAAVSRLAEAAGWRVFGWDLRVDAPLLSDSRTHHVVDVTDPKQVDVALDTVHELHGRPADAVVHCAGVYRTGAAIEVALEDWIDVVTVNLVGSFSVARSCADRSIRAGAPLAVVLLSSVASTRGDRVEPGSAYAASKGGIEALVRQLAVEWSEFGIRCNAVMPGVIDTPMTTITGSLHAAERLVERLPARRFGRAEEVASMCLYLLGEDAGYITGTTIAVDGGYTIS